MSNEIIVKNISSDPKDPAYEAYISCINTYVFGSSFAELEEGIQLSLASSKKLSQK